MGQTGTKVASKIVNSFSFTGGVSDEDIEQVLEQCDGQTLERFRGSAPLVSLVLFLTKSERQARERFRMSAPLVYIFQKS